MSLGFSSNKFKENVIIYYIKITRHLLLGRKVITNLDNILKSRDFTLPTKGPSHQSYGFSSSHVWMRELDYKDS